MDKELNLESFKDSSVMRDEKKSQLYDDLINFYLENIEIQSIHPDFGYTKQSVYLDKGLIFTFIVERLKNE